jgi:hypothetical protein
VFGAVLVEAVWRGGTISLRMGVVTGRVGGDSSGGSKSQQLSTGPLLVISIMWDVSVCKLSSDEEDRDEVLLESLEEVSVFPSSSIELSTLWGGVMVVVDVVLSNLVEWIILVEYAFGSKLVGCVFYHSCGSEQKKKQLLDRSPCTALGVPVG